MDLITLRNQIEDTNSLLMRLHRDLTSYPDRSTLLLEIDSLTRRRRQLESEFATAADQFGQDICRYRILGSAERRPSVRNVAQVLDAFQRLVTIVYDGLTNRPKERGRASAESIEQTDFEFGYSSPGSLVVNLIIPNERLLLRESDLDDAVTTVFEMARARSSKDILTYAERAGRASVRSLYAWVDTHIDSDCGVDVEWSRQLEVRSELVLQRQEFQRLKEMIVESGEEEKEEMDLTGWLTGADVKRKWFRFRGPDDLEITGSFGDAISEAHAAEIPHRYGAHFVKTSRVQFATDLSDEQYFLERLISVM